MNSRDLLVAGPVGKLAVTVTDGPEDLTPVCFIHPVNTAGSVWADVATQLRPARRCALPDLRGHGGSVYSGPFTVEDYAADVVAVLDGVGFERAHLVGASIGGPVAVALAARLPERVATVTGFGTALALHLDAATLAQVKGVLDTDGVRALFSQLGPGALGAAHRDRLGPAVIELTTGVDRSPAMVYEMIAATFSSDVTALAPMVQAPCLVANGDEDGACPPAAATAMGAALRAHAVLTFAGVGHLPMLEVPDEVAALLDEHFAAGEIPGRPRKG